MTIKEAKRALLKVTDGKEYDNVAKIIFDITDRIHDTDFRKNMTDTNKLWETIHDWAWQFDIEYMGCDEYSQYKKDGDYYGALDHFLLKKINTERT